MLSAEKNTCILTKSGIVFDRLTIGPWELRLFTYLLSGPNGYRLTDDIFRCIFMYETFLSYFNFTEVYFQATPRIQAYERRLLLQFNTLSCAPFTDID